MGIYLYDDSIPLDFSGLEMRERHGFKEAVCPGCGGWVRIRDDYKGDRTVMRAINHVPRCYYYENFFTSKEYNNG